MAKTTIGVNAELLEVNRYDFYVEVNSDATEEEQNKEAIAKIKKFLETNLPYPNSKEIDGICCVDRESAMETKGVVSVTVNDGQ